MKIKLYSHNRHGLIQRIAKKQKLDIPQSIRDNIHNRSQPV